MDFSWDNMAGNLQDNALTNKKSYDDEVDTRFWKLSRDTDGNGGAIIRFLPDLNNVPFVKMIKINARTSQKGYFVKDWSPQTIGLQCPFNDEFSKLWKAGDKETAKTLGRQFRYIMNIKVMKDPANSDNEGKIFLYEMSSSMMDSIKEVMVQTEAMKALEEEPVQVFNPIAGNSFLIKVKNGENDIPTYTSSKFADKVTSIYATEAEAEADIIENTYALSEFLSPEKFLSTDELNDKLDRFLKRGKYSPEAQAGSETEAIQQAEVKTGLNLGGDKTAETAPKVETPAPKVETPSANVEDEIDGLLAEIEG